MSLSRSKAILCPCRDVRIWAERTQRIAVKWSETSRHAQLLRNNVQIQWATSFRRLLVSAHAGCQACILVVRAIETYEPDMAQIEEIYLKLGTLVPQLKVAFPIQPESENRSSHRESRDSRRGFWLSHPDGYRGYEAFGPGFLKAPQQPRPADLVSNIDHKVHIIREWIMGCLESHKSCQTPGFAPRRLLHVGLGTVDMNHDTVRLVEPPPIMTEPFIALSHCWGKTKQAVTTKANYAQRLSSISVSQLSKTFQDAIWLTRRLGIRFIWIDSLCIIQDDADDWEREAVTMSQLYSAAYITIAAAHGSDGAAGILYESPSGAHRQVEVALRDPDGDVEMATATIMSWSTPDKQSPTHQMYKTAGDQAFVPDENRDYAQDALLGRGWAFQERVLSTRIVHFTRGELVWECKAMRDCECGSLRGNGVLNSYIGSLRSDSSDDDDEMDTDDDANGLALNEDNEDYRKPGIEKIEEAWWNFVELFTTRELTKQEDRGPAFAGIAQSFGSHLIEEDDDELGEYCAGLWSQFLPWDLFWSCSVTQFPIANSPSRRIKDSMAPSWSWYSVSGTCHLLTSKYSHDDLLYLDEFGDDIGTMYEFEAVGTSPYGRLRRGALTIEYMGIALATRASDTGPFSLSLGLDKPNSSVCSIHLLADDEDDAKHTREMSCLYMYQAHHEVVVEKTTPYVGIDKNGQDYHENYLDSQSCREHFAGLALVAVSGEVDTYRRIGLFHAEGTSCLGLWDKSLPESVPRGPSTRVWAREDVPPPSGVYRDWMESIEMKNNIVLI